MRGRGVAAPATARVTMTRMKTGRTDGGAGPGVPETVPATHAQAAHVATATSGDSRLRGREAMVLPDILHRSGREPGMWFGCRFL
jgi:hypothetical protein